MILSLVLATVVSQEPPAEARPAPISEAAALEKLSAAAERLAAAAERLSPPPLPEDPTKPPPKLDVWTGGAGVSMTWVTGNASSLALVATGQASRKSERTIVVVKGFGAYGEALAASGTSSEVLLYNAGLAGQFDYRFTKRISAFVGAGLDTDHVKSVEIRGYGELGIGVLWLDEKEGEPGKEFQKLYLKTDLGIRAQPEERFQYFPVRRDLPGATMVGPRLGVSFRYALSPGTYFTEEAEVLPNVLPNEPGRVLVNSTSKLAVGIAAHLAITAMLQVKFDSTPAVGRKDTDTTATLGLDATF